MPRASEPGFGARHRWWRETYGNAWLRSIGAERFSLREFCKHLGANPATVSAWESRSRTPDRATLERMCAKVVGTPEPVRMAVWIITGVGDPPGPRSPGDKAPVASPARPDEVSARTPAWGSVVKLYEVAAWASGRAEVDPEAALQVAKLEEVIRSLRESASVNSSPGSGSSYDRFQPEAVPALVVSTVATGDNVDAEVTQGGNGLRTRARAA